MPAVKNIASSAHAPSVMQTSATQTDPVSPVLVEVFRLNDTPEKEPQPSISSPIAGVEIPSLSRCVGSWKDRLSGEVFQKKVRAILNNASFVPDFSSALPGTEAFKKCMQVLLKSTRSSS